MESLNDKHFLLHWTFLDEHLRLEVRNQNNTLALDRAIAGFLVRSSFNISYLESWQSLAVPAVGGVPQSLLRKQTWTSH